jgi:hypothetical protein
MGSSVAARLLCQDAYRAIAPARLVAQLDS